MLYHCRCVSSDILGLLLEKVYLHLLVDGSSRLPQDLHIQINPAVLRTCVRRLCHVLVLCLRSGQRWLNQLVRKDVLAAV